jgi:hypothetical protein
MANVITMGFEGQVFYGVKGSTAATQIGNSRDIKISVDPQMGDTTVRGTTGTAPVETEGVSSLKWSMTLNMVNSTSDAVVSALKTAAYGGTQVAIRMKDYAAGKGYDGDCNVKCEQGVPIKGEQTVDFTFTPNRDSRAPSLYI